MDPAPVNMHLAARALGAHTSRPDKTLHNIWAHRPGKRQCLPTDTNALPRESYINKLPEELILQVMHGLDASSLFCLRRTSQRFMRLFGADDFRAHHGAQTTGAWQSENLDKIKGKKAFRIFCEQIARDRLCEGCVAAQTGPDSKASKYHAWAEKSMHCGGCKIDHPACVFSADQRRVHPRRRVCIAREGTVHVCEHQTLAWQELEDEVLDMAVPERKGAIIVSCGCDHERREVRFTINDDTYRLALTKGLNWRLDVGTIEWDWDAGDGVDPSERDWCAERDYTYLSASARASSNRPPLVPESYWYRQLDPESFRLTDEEESFEVTWCWDKSCPNYFRHYELRRGRRVYIPCGEGCEEGKILEKQKQMRRPIL